MSLIKITDLTFSYEGSCDNVFENVSIQIDTDWKLGFVGRNGRGKTTFLNLLMGKLKYTGNIYSDAAFDYFPFPINDKTRYTDEIVKDYIPDTEDWKIFRELNLMKADTNILYRPFNTLSGGEQLKIMLTVLFLKENNFLLLDEPSNHLDIETKEAIADYLAKKSGFILVSHDRELLDKCTDHIISLNKNNIDIQKGNFSSWYAQKTAHDNYELQQNKLLNNEIAQLRSAAERTSSWSQKSEKTKKGTKNSGLRPDTGYIGHKSAKMMKRSKSIEKRQLNAIEEKSGLLHNIETMDPLKITPLKYHSKKLLSFNKVNLFYGENSVCRNISFDVYNGDKICISGKNGCGKTTLLKLINGENILYTGGFFKGSGLKISYVSQNTSELKGRLKDFSDANNLNESLFKAILRKMDIERSQFKKDLSELSDGQKKKVLLAKSLSEQAHIYLWDEPLNFIDIFSRIQIEELLLNYSPTIIFVEHDTAFRKNISSKTIELKKDDQ